MSDVTVILIRHSGVLYREKMYLNSELLNIYQRFHLPIKKHICASQKCVSRYPQTSYLFPVQNHIGASPHSIT